MLGVLSILEEEDMLWLPPWSLANPAFPGVKSTEELREILTPFPWLDNLHIDWDTDRCVGD